MTSPMTAEQLNAQTERDNDLIRTNQAVSLVPQSEAGHTAGVKADVPETDPKPTPIKAKKTTPGKGAKEEGKGKGKTQAKTPQVAAVAEPKKERVWALGRIRVVRGAMQVVVLGVGDHNTLEAMAKGVNKDAGTRVAFVIDANELSDAAREAAGEVHPDDDDEDGEEDE